MGSVVLLSWVVVGASLAKSLKRAGAPFIPERITGKHAAAYLLLVILLGVVPRILSLSVLQATDEEYYVYVAGEAYRDFRVYDRINFVHPPLYPLVTSFVFRMIGVGLAQAKLTPMVLSLATLPLLFVLSRKYYGINAALYTTFAYATTPFVIFYGSNPMLYAELIFFSVLASYLFLTALKEERPWRMTLAGVCVGLATGYRLFGLFLVFVGLAFLCIRRKGVWYAAAYLLGFLAVTVPLFSFYYHLSPQSFPYLLLKVHENKAEVDIGVWEKALGLGKSILIYPLILLFPLFVFANKHTLMKEPLPKMPKDADADLFFGLWLAGAPLILAIPTYKDFLPAVYALYFIPAAAALSGKLAGALNRSHLRALAIGIVMTSAGATWFGLMTDAENATTVAGVSSFIRDHTNASETITGTFATAHIVSFFTGRQLTEDVLNITDVGVWRYRGTEAAASLGICPPGIESYEKDILTQSAYVIVRDSEPSTYYRNKTFDSMECPTAAQFTNVTVYSCRT